MTEARIQAKILAALNALPNVRVFRNNVGVATTATGHTMRFGLCIGSADLIGWRTLPSGIAQFLSIEVKNHRGILTDRQHIWMHNVAKAGGLAFVARSVDEALARVA